MNGLDMMKKQKESRPKRVANPMPTPLHPARSTPVTLPEMDSPAADGDAPAAGAPAVVPTVTVTDQVEGTATAPAAKAERRATTAAPVTAAAPAPAEVPSGAARGALYPITAYLELAEDQFIQDVRTAGRHGTPRVTSGAAVIRFALQRLAADMTPEQVVAAMRAAAPATTNQGRIRL